MSLYYYAPLKRSMWNVCDCIKKDYKIDTLSFIVLTPIITKYSFKPVKLGDYKKS